MSQVRPDQQLVFHGRYWQQQRERVKALLTDELIESYRRHPQGPYSDALMRVLVHFGSGYKYALYAQVPLREYIIITLPATPGAMPERTDNRVFSDLNEARHALFLLNVADLRRGDA